MSIEVIKYRLWCNTESAWKDVLLQDGEPVPTKCPTDTAHVVDESKTNITGRTWGLVRTHAEDGSLVAKLDPGMPDTDPKYFADGPHEISEDQVVDFICPFTAAGKRFQGVRIQVLGGKAGDLVDLMLVSDGSLSQFFGPVDTVIQSFGPVNAPIGKDGEWGGDQLPPPSIATSKLIPSGLRLEVRYDSTSEVGVRKLLIDYLMQV